MCVCARRQPSPTAASPGSPWSPVRVPLCSAASSIEDTPTHGFTTIRTVLVSLLVTAWHKGALPCATHDRALSIGHLSMGLDANEQDPPRRDEVVPNKAARAGRPLYVLLPLLLGVTTVDATRRARTLQDVSALAAIDTEFASEAAASAPPAGHMGDEVRGWRKTLRLFVLFMQ